MGDEDEDGLSVEEGRIALNGGAIEDTANRAVNVPYPELATQSDHKGGAFPPPRFESAEAP